ncbi:MAG: hypothetical protein F9K40_07500 [Kofleriaceae bacterium]|nr:MAG: hypothetical protein F9K40_07500 [Kofleriaceae bacterium]
MPRLPRRRLHRAVVPGARPQPGAAPRAPGLLADPEHRLLEDLLRDRALDAELARRHVPPARIGGVALVDRQRVGRGGR